MHYVDLARARSARGEVVLRERRDSENPDENPDEAPDVDECADEDPQAQQDPEAAGRHAVLELRVNGVYVMDTAQTGTERALAETALAMSAQPTAVLVGGLGLGFTVQAVLSDPRVRRCTVAEIEPALVEWMRAGLVGHGPALLADERVEVRVADVADVLSRTAPGTFDLVLLDVDNGPGNLVHAANAALYGAPFLHVVRAALRPGGALVVWSAAPAPELAAALRGVFGHVAVRAEPVRLGARAECYWLYAAAVEASG